MESLHKFKVQKKIPVNWGDMDAFQHVNNTVYLKWIESARVDYLANFITGEFAENGLGPILARIDCRYVFPLTYPDNVIVGYRTSEILQDRIIGESRVYSERHQRLSAISYNTIMAYDFTALKKVAIPEDWKFKIEMLDF